MSHYSQNPMLRIWLLGGFRVHIGERVLTPSDIRLRAAQQIIKLLALAPDYRLHREQVLAAIWPEQKPHAAVNSLNQALYSARRALAPESDARRSFLTLRDQQLRLGKSEQIWVDAVAFDSAARRARQQQDVVGTLAALDLYAGDLLPDDPYNSWLDTRRNALRQTYRSLVLDAAARALYHSKRAASITSTCRGSSAGAGVLWFGCAVSLIAVSLSCKTSAAPARDITTNAFFYSAGVSLSQLSGAISARIEY